MNFVQHVLVGHVRRACSCDEWDTWHRLIKAQTIVRVFNRSRVKHIGLFRKHKVCVRRRSEYFFCRCAIFECLHCGKRKIALGPRARTTRKKAEESGLPILSNWSDWSRLV